MKKLLFIIVTLSVLSLSLHAMGAGTVAISNSDPATPLNSSGTSVEIQFTADSSNGAFPIVLFGDTRNTGTYGYIKGRWLTSVRTRIPLAINAPTANWDVYIIDGVDTASDFVLTTPTLAVGSNADDVATAAFTFVIDGVSYSKAAVTTGTAPGDDVIVATKYGAVAFDIGANGTIDAIEATGQAAAQFASEALAIAAVPACASDHVRIGYVTATKSDGAFTFGTTELSAANVTENYISTVPAYDIMGGRLVNRSATAVEEVYPANTLGDNKYHFVDDSIMVVPVGNSVNSAIVTIDLILN